MAHSPHQDGRTAVIAMVALGPRRTRPHSCVAGRRPARRAVPRWPGSRSPCSRHHDRHGRAVAMMAQSPRQGGRTTTIAMDRDGSQSIAMDRDGSRWPMARRAHNHDHHDGRAVARNTSTTASSRDQRSGTALGVTLGERHHRVRRLAYLRTAGGAARHGWVAGRLRPHGHSAGSVARGA